MDQNRDGPRLPHRLQDSLQKSRIRNLLFPDQNTKEGSIMEKFNSAKYSKVIYQLNPETKYYRQSIIERQETSLNRLPEELRIAPVGASQIKPNADTILLSRLKNGKYIFRTGLQKTYFEWWKLGNDFEYING